MEKGRKWLYAKEFDVHKKDVETGVKLWKDCGRKEPPHDLHITSTNLKWKLWKSLFGIYSNLPLIELFKSRMISPRSGSFLMRLSTRLTEEMTVE